jgi:hypothetical protein
MNRTYWLGLSLFFFGLALWNIPTGDYRLFTMIAGTLVQLAGTVLMVMWILKARRSGAKMQPRTVRIFIVVTVLALVAGVIAGFLLVGLF